MKFPLLRPTAVLFLLFGLMALRLPAQHVTGIGRIVPPAPTFADLFRVKPGDRVELDGTSLLAITDVRFNTASAAFFSRTDTQLVVTVPPDATIGPVSWYDRFGFISSTAANFQVAPRVTQFARNIPIPSTPADAIRGVPGNSILFTGANYADANDPGFQTSVFFQSALGGTVAGLVEFASGTTLQVQVPGAAVSGSMILSNPAGSVTTVGRFYLQPFITGFNPPQARVGDLVTVKGFSLLDATDASVGGQPAAILSVNSTNLVFRVPALDDSGLVSLTTPGGAFLTSSNLVLLPKLDSFTPVGGPAGTVVTLQGSGLAGTTAVRFGNTASIAVTNLDSTSVSAVVPAGAFTGPITVVTANGSSVSGNLFYVAPVVTDFSPTRARPGAIITVNGVNFTGVSAVEFTSGQAASFNVQATNRLTVLVPDDASNGPIRVTTPGGTAVSTISFQVIGTDPLILGFTPAFAGVGATVKITGENLAGATSVRFNGISTTSFVGVGGTNITVTVPEGATTGKLSVLTPIGTATSTADFLVGSSADLSVTGQINPPAPALGATVTVSYQLRNLGPLPVDGVTLAIGLPSGVDVLQATTSSGTLEQLGLGITVHPAAMPMNSLVTVALQVRLNRSARLDFVADASSDFPDAIPSNNTLTLSVTPGQPALSVALAGDGSLTLSWPVTAGFGLQSSTTMTGGWQNVTDVPTIAGGISSLKVIPSGTALYYRLRQGP